MNKILITGASGNISSEVVNALFELKKENEIILAGRNFERTMKKFEGKSGLKFRQFDFENEQSFKAAFEKIEILFLLRPPHISDVEKYFRPLLNAAKNRGIQNVVFLSVQGAEKSKVIPHNKIERLIKELDFNYIFVRPSYFMQNLTTALLPEIFNQQSITLPSGKAKFNWIDVKNIGEATAILCSSFQDYKNDAYEITGSENMNFNEVVDLMTDLLDREYTFKSLNPLSFYFKKRKEGIESGFAIVMTILHFLPRLQGEPEISDDFYRITNRNPTSLQHFIQREKKVLTS